MYAPEISIALLVAGGAHPDRKPVRRFVEPEPFSSGGPSVARRILALFRPAPAAAPDPC